MRRIKAVNGFNQAQVAFLNQVGQGDTALYIAAGNVDDEENVAFDEPLPRFAPSFGRFMQRFRRFPRFQTGLRFAPRQHVSNQTGFIVMRQ
ncbi:hypothetical protein SE16_14415 [Ardenticatena maritima]|uniref:Uncharacterized protein n=1 Tax=Ardenticatena maritima TaxID=872965 RepID=A0A0P6Y3L0_9CHLR|nr:hypothetical protein SE16_14415 [Ardenticatena maritima]